MATDIGMIPLHLMQPGERGRVVSVTGTAELVHRLHEIGLRDGRQIEMVQRGSPCIVRLDGHAICFRADETMSVLVAMPGDDVA